MLVRRYEGVYVVLPHCGDPAYPPALPEGLAEALGPDAWRHLNAKLAADAAQEQQQQEQLAGAADSTLAAAARRRGGRRAQHSLVILHQRLQPALRPPPGLGGYVRGELECSCAACFLLLICGSGRLLLISAAATHIYGTNTCHMTKPVSCLPTYPPTPLTPTRPQAKCGASLSACSATCTEPARRCQRHTRPCRVSGARRPRQVDDAFQVYVLALLSRAVQATLHTTVVLIGLLPAATRRYQPLAAFLPAARHLNNDGAPP